MLLLVARMIYKYYIDPTESLVIVKFSVVARLFVVAAVLEVAVVAVVVALLTNSYSQLGDEYGVLATDSDRRVGLAKQG